MKAIRIIALLLVLCMFSTVLLACNSGKNIAPAGDDVNNEKENDANDNVDIDVEADDALADNAYSSAEALEADDIVIGGVSVKEYNIVLAADPLNSEVAFANALAAWIKSSIDVDVKIIDDSTAETAYEILIGKTNRSASTSGKALTANHDFNVAVKEGKLTINAKHKFGYNLAFTAMVHHLSENNGAIVSDFSNNKLSYTDIKALTVGCITYSSSDMGLHFCKSTQKQIDAWTNYTKTWSSNTQCAKYATGVRLDFDTDSSYFYFKVTDGYECVVLINGKQVLQGVSSHFQFLDTANETNHVTIILPKTVYANWALEEFEVDKGSNTKLHDFDLKLLFLGDSITEGYNNNGNEANTYTFQLSQHLNAYSVVQGNSGARFWVDMLDPAMADLYQPDVIIVSLGTNDWSGQKDAWERYQFNDWCNSYLDKLRTIYPDTPIVGITPIQRLEDGLDNHKTPFNEAMLAYKEAFEAHGAFVVDGRTLVEHDYEFYNDSVHPNGVGFVQYGANLYEAIKDYVAEVMAD